MKVLKFGGAAIGSSERMKRAASIILKAEEPVFVVLSAMSGTTAALTEISDYLDRKNPDGANELINSLEKTYLGHCEELFSTQKRKESSREFLQGVFGYLRSFTKDVFTAFEKKSILAQGEIMSTTLMADYLQERGKEGVTLLSALDFMRTDKSGEPDSVYIKDRFRCTLEKHPGSKVYITQGFICRNAYGEIDNLRRGGSDYTASLVGAAIGAEEIQVWTDVDLMNRSFPQVVNSSAAGEQRLNFDEAAELAYFGAKILHPTCVQPAKFAGIPVRLLNTAAPDDPGTIISRDSPSGQVKAVAAKDNITAIKIKSSRMLLATGFLRKVFEIFESYQTAIDMIVTSEVGVSMSIDNASHLGEIVEELKKYGTVTVDRDMCLVCVVGDLAWTNVGLETLAAEALRDIPVRMISYGGSNCNISFLIRESDKQRALQSLCETLFEGKKRR